MIDKAMRFIRCAYPVMGVGFLVAQQLGNAAICFLFTGAFLLLGWRPWRV